MGIATIYRKPRTSAPGTGSAHRVFPYLLKGLAIERPNQVWATDITYTASPRPPPGSYLIGITSPAPGSYLVGQDSGIQSRAGAQLGMMA